MYSSGNIDVRNFLNHPVFCTVVRLLNGPFRSQSQYRTQHFSGAVTAVALPVLLRVSAPVTAHSLSVFTPNSRCCKIHATVKPLPKTVITNLRSGTSRQNHNTAERGASCEFEILPFRGRSGTVPLTAHVYIGRRNSIHVFA